MKSSSALLASLLIAASALTACRPMPQGTGATTAPTAAPTAPVHSSQPWLLPAATLEESLAQLTLHADLQTYEKVLQQLSQSRVEMEMAKARALEETDPEMIALKARENGLARTTGWLRHTITNTRDHIESQRASWIAEQDRRRADAAEKMSGSQ
jgi:hypothetical protein